MWRLRRIILPFAAALSEYSGDVWIYDYQFRKCRHADDVPVLFGSKTEPGRDSNSPADTTLEPDADALGVTMRSVWGRFAKSGSPGWEMYKDSRDIHIFK